MTHDELRERVALYFDGELPAADEPAVLDHLAECEDCQHELGDAMAIHALVETPPAVTPIRAKVDAQRKAPQRSWVRPALVGGFAAAAAVVAVLAWPRATSGPGETPVALALPTTRALEVRFTAPAFASHRPYDVARSGARSEAISLDALAELERRGDITALVAALASSGDRARAGSLAERVPAADRAALAVINGRPEQALELVEGDTSPAARWNLALAARELGLIALAADQFGKLAASGEPGWSDEAKRRAQALVEQRRNEQELAAFRKRAQSGTITEADIARHPAFARIAVLDALRLAPDRESALALAPLADALDRASGTTHARAAIDRVARADFGVRTRFRDRYLALTQGTSDPARADELLDELKRAGPSVEDLYFGAIVWTGRIADRLADLRARTHGDPWFELMVEHEQLRADAERLGAPAVHTRAREATDRCAAVWAYRCGQLALVTAGIAADVGLLDDALAYARKARQYAVSAGAIELEVDTLAFLGEIERYRGRRAVSRALFEEVELRLATINCQLASYARIGRAKIALVDGDVAQARGLMRALETCSPPDEIAVEVVVDLARLSRAAEDRELAHKWLERARSSGQPRFTAMVEVGAPRLALATDPAAAATLREWIARHPPVDTPAFSMRAWATDALIVDAGERSDWAAVADAARAEVGLPVRDRCTVVASVDQDRQVVAVRDAAGRWTGRARRAPIDKLDAATFVPQELVDALAGCKRVDVLARPPLHGRTLLPPAIPWAFVGEPPREAKPRPWRAVIVADAMPPDPTQELPRLDPTAAPDGVTMIRGAAATPTRVLEELATASYVEINAHGIANLDVADASYIALSPDPSGRFALTATAVRNAKIAGAIVVLAACRGTRNAPYLHRRWSLPDAFLAAGARAVIATDVDVPDRAAAAVFGELRTRITAGEDPATALAAIRSAAIARDPASWVGHVVLFE